MAQLQNLLVRLDMAIRIIKSLSKVMAGSAGEFVFLLILVFCSVGAFLETFRFKNVPWDSLGLAFWPRLLLCGLVLLLGVRLLHLWRSAEDQDRVSIRGFLSGMFVLALCMACVAGINTFGIYLLTPVFFISFAIAAKSKSRVKTIVISGATSLMVILFIYVVFEQLLGLQVPLGAIGEKLWK